MIGRNGRSTKYFLLALVVLVLAGLRSDAGCEVMAIPGLVLGRRTHLACIVFSPIDWLEEKVL